MAYGIEIKTDDRAKAVLDKYGLLVTTTIDYGYDRRDFYPDKTFYSISKDGELIFDYSCLGEERVGAKVSDGEFETSALKACLDCASGTRYLEQSRLFKTALAELMELKKAHKFSKFGEKKELKEKCEKLCEYRYRGRSSYGEPTFSINVPLMEDNRLVLENALKELEALRKEVEKETKKVEAAPEEPAGPANA